MTWRHRDSTPLREMIGRAVADGLHDARDLAEAHGMMLAHTSRRCYTLTGPGGAWAIDIYPAMQVIQRRAGQFPTLHVRAGCEWTLADVVEAAISACRFEGNSKGERNGIQTRNKEAEQT